MSRGRSGSIPPAILILLSVAAFCRPADAATLRVNPGGGGPYPTIQAAIDAAHSGDVVELENGVYTSDGNRDISFEGKSITVHSRSGDPTLCIIDCGGWADTTAPHRGFMFSSGESAFSVLSDITVRNGLAYGP